MTADGAEYPDDDREVSDGLDVDENATRQLGDWNRYYGGEFSSPADVVREFLGEDTALVDVVTDRYTAAINTVLNESGIYLRGEVFYADAAAVDISAEVIQETFEYIDLAEIADAVEAEREKAGETE